MKFFLPQAQIIVKCPGFAQEGGGLNFLFDQHIIHGIHVLPSCLCFNDCIFFQWLKNKKKNKLTVLSSKYIVLDKKSIPIVACTKRNDTVTNQHPLIYILISYFSGLIPK